VPPIKSKKLPQGQSVLLERGEMSLGIACEAHNAILNEGRPEGNKEKMHPSMGNVAAADN